MNTILKRVISLVLCIVLVAGYLPAGALAAENGETVTVATEVTTEPTQAASEETEALSESTKATEPSTEATEPSTETTEPSTEAAEPEVIAVTGITLDVTELEVGVGELPMTLTATVLPGDAADKTVTWTSSEPGVASVDENGELTFGYMGEAVITAACGEFTATCTVTVGEGEWSGYADDTTDYLFLATDRHANTSILAAMINAMESSIGENTLDYLALGGDMVGSGGDHPTYNSSTVLGEVTGATSSLSAVNVDIVAGIHDMNVNDDAGIVLPYSGGGAQIFEGNKFYVYGVPESCISGAVSGVDPETEAKDFVTWASSVADKSKAIIVVSHYPLHQRRNDNDGAVYWASALNTVAAGDDTTIDRNVAFFWGHNHTGESNADTAVYHVAPNGSISVEGGSSSQTIYFTYANAGYLNAKHSATLVTITDETITFDKYDSSSVSTSNSVDRVAEAAPTLSSIAISGDIAYFVGDALALTVTATYSDGTTADVTADATLSGYNMATAGTYTVTASYEGLTTEYTITVTAPAVTKIEITTLPTTLVYDQAGTLDTTGMVVTAAYNNGATADVTDKAYVFGAVDMATAGEKTVTIAYSDNGVIHKATYTITVQESVADGLVLQRIKVLKAPAKTEYLISEALDLDGIEVAAYFSDGTEGAEETMYLLSYAPFAKDALGGYDLDNFSMYVEKAHEVKVTYTYGGVTCIDTFTINVWDEDFTDEATSVKVHVTGDYGVTAISVAESSNTNVSAAIADVISGDSYVAYDISLTFDEGYSETDTTKTVTLPIPEGVNNPVVYYVSDDGETVTNMNATKDGNGNVTFQTTHFSTYVIGESTEIEVPGNDTATGSGTTTTTESKEVYVLVSSISAAGDYLISNTNSATTSAHLLTAADSDVTDTSNVTIQTSKNASGNTIVYIENPANAAIWTATSNSGGWRLQNTSSTSRYLRYNNGLTTTSSSNYATTWYSNTNTVYRTSSGSARYLRYNSSWTISTSSQTVYVYQKQTVNFTTTTTVSGTYSIEGQDLSAAVSEGSTANLTSTLTFTPDSGTATTTDVSTTATYEVVTTDASGNTVDGDPNDIIANKIENGVVTFSGSYGTALVKVSYKGSFGTVTDYITIEATAPYYTIELCDPVTDDEGNTTYVSIEKPVALKGVKTGDTYSVWAVVKEHTAANPDGVDQGELGDDLSWTVSDTSIATIDTATGVITFTGTNYGTFTVTVAYEGADGVVITDTITISATESQYVVPGDGTDDFPEYPNEGAVRFDKTATAVGNFSETGIAMVELSMTGVPYSTGSEIDVVLMLDMTGSMSNTAMVAAEEAAVAFVAQIVKNEDGSYNDNRVAVYAFNSSSSSPFELVALGTIDSDTELEAANTAIKTASDKKYSGGTPYDEALEKCQEVLTAAKTTNLPEDTASAEDYSRQQFCVFMSDGGPTSFEYITNYDAVKAGTATTYSTSTASAQGGQNQSDSNFATIATYTHEYYSTLMKDDGVTMFSVLTGLSADNYPNCATILENIASSSDNAYVVPDGDDTSAVSGALSSIAQKIVEAARDVKVEDKIGINYSMNFSIPGHGTGNAVEEAALDGLTEFYIQVVEYQLNADKERTGDPTVLENFTFNEDGSFKSHTVNGTACEDCSHVTTTDGVITKIEGTYFTYTSTDDGEILTWEADKISTTELALQYFAHLDDSSGVTPDDQIAAGTYYTNEYATLTYTNYRGNEVQREFPTPQMTWNGAQVSYVFYLVNEAGQPVNRAGRVVPFAEAVYVTDVYTYSVIWNDLEQSAGLEAKYLAEQLVPEVYALYDDDASYNIHVYEDENEVNLNNHFVIGGDVTDDYNKTANDDKGWTNAETTYVFNNKSDATKYNEAGAYIANDGDDSKDSDSYYCKSAAIKGATYTTSVDAAGVTVYTVTGLGSGYQQVDGETQVAYNSLPSKTGATEIGDYAYYVDENGQVYTIVQKADGEEVEKGFDFSNTTVAFAVVWKPGLVEDAVVMDYGLDVVIDVITNDNMAAGVVGVRTSMPDAEINSGTYEAAKARTVEIYIDANNDNGSLKELKIGTASVENLNQVRFSLDGTNGMQFTDPAVFYYEADVNYYDSTNELKTTSMYSSVTVIPATTVYYEDDFLTLASYTKSGDAWTQDETSQWTASVQNSVQDQDRPGASKISAALDADNVYGYDSAYETMSTHSLNNAAKITVNANTYGTAEFTFYGTGFDVISTTSNATGTITVLVKNASGATVRNTIVDTYYGMEENGMLSVNTPDTIYQVPVIKIFDLPYGQYTVKITAAYNQIFDHATEKGDYDLYLDAIRIYDPTGNQDDTANDAYIADGEAWPVYEELRNNIIAASDVTVTENEDGFLSVTVNSSETGALSGAIFIDCNDENTSIADYVSYGPNNELYLANGQAIAFKVVDTNIADIQLGIKLANGTSATYEISAATADGTVVKKETITVSTTTDMYYSILDYAKDGKTVTIKNVSGGILSLTNIKVTHTSAPAEASGISLLSMDAESAGVALMMLRRAPVVEEEEIPETTVPEETEPEETIPEITEPEETEPDVTEPETEPTEPEVTEPEVTEPEVVEPEEDTSEGVTVEKVIETVKKIVKKLFGWLFG